MDNDKKRRLIEAIQGDMTRRRCYEISPEGRQAIQDYIMWMELSLNTFDDGATYENGSEEIMDRVGIKLCGRYGIDYLSDGWLEQAQIAILQRLQELAGQ